MTKKRQASSRNTFFILGIVAIDRDAIKGPDLNKRIN